MTCAEVSGLLDAFVDGELDLQTSVAVEAHLNECPECAQQVQGKIRLQDAITDAGLYFPAPREVRQRVRRSLRGGLFRWHCGLRRWRRFSCLFSAGCCALRIGALEQAVMSGHVRSLMPNHLLDVPSRRKPHGEAVVQRRSISRLR